MLDDFLGRMADVVRRVPEAEPFALAGGGALTVHGRIDRITKDLDYFARTPDQVDTLLPVLEQALREAGYQVQREQTGHGFARLRVSDAGREGRIDLGYDYRLMDALPSAVGPILAEEELAADKVLAIHGRAEARDYLDLHALVQQFGYIRPLEWAQQKDPGFSRAVFAERLGRMDRLPRDAYDAPDYVLDRVRQDFVAWRGRLLSLERDPPTATRRDPEIDRGRTPGSDERERGVDGPGLDI